MIDNGQRVKHDGYITDIITDLSLDWLKQRDKSKPFLLMCSTRRRTASGSRPCGTSATTTTASTPSRRRSSTITPAAARPSTSRT